MALKAGKKARKGLQNGLPVTPYKKPVAESQAVSNNIGSDHGRIKPAPQSDSSTGPPDNSPNAVRSRATLYSRIFSSTKAEMPLNASSTDPPQVPKSASKPTLSPSSLNAFAVSQLSAGRFGSESKIKDGGLPANYKSTARR